MDSSHRRLYPSVPGAHGRPPFAGPGRGQSMPVVSLGSAPVRVSDGFSLQFSRHFCDSRRGLRYAAVACRVKPTRPDLRDIVRVRSSAFHLR